MGTRRGAVWLVLGVLLLSALVAGWVTLASSPSSTAPGASDPSTEDGATPSSSKPEPLAGSRPNVLWILVDDMRDDELRYMPRTKRLLVDQGVRFRNSFAPYPWCCPARASLLTGQYSHNHGVLSIRDPWGFHAFDDSSTLATWLREAGYNTVYLGKYLNGYGFMPPPGKTSGGSTDYRPPGWTRWHATADGLPLDHPKFGETYLYFDTTLSNDSNGYIALEGRFQTTAYAGITERLIKEYAPKPKPFFLVASYTAPHFGYEEQPGDPQIPLPGGGSRPLVVPANPDWVRGKFDRQITAAPGADWADPDPSDEPEYLRSRQPLSAPIKQAVLQLTRKRAESLEVLDRSVARTVRALRRADVLDETMIVFHSDNGYFLGEQKLRQGKLFPNEVSIRVPTFVRGPGVPRGEVRDDPVTSLDFAPTIAELAGAEPGVVVDGDSVLDSLVQDRGWGRGILLNTGPHNEPGTPFPGVRETDISGRPLDSAGAGPRDERWLIGVRTPRWAYWELATGEKELYDVIRDPRQYDNLAGEPRHARTQAQLHRLLERLRDCQGPPCRQDLPRSLARP